MDPQQRMLLEMSYEAMENAGWQRESYAGSSTAVYAAIFPTDFYRNIYKDTLDLPTYCITGTEKAIRKQASFFFFFFWVFGWCHSQPLFAFQRATAPWAMWCVIDRGGLDPLSRYLSNVKRDSLTPKNVSGQPHLACI